MIDKNYWWGLKKQWNPEGYYWCPTWKLYKDSEGEWEKYKEADKECAKKNLELVIERGYADKLMLTMCPSVKPYISYRKYYESVINRDQL